LLILSPTLLILSPSIGAGSEISEEELRDRIFGGWVGMLIGGLEGLAHEFKYREKPREDLPDFTFLAQGARSDDDNDIEWIHLWFMWHEDTLKLDYSRIVPIWKLNMNHGVWVANRKARQLMDEGLVPPDTGHWQSNPYAWYNLSAQFATEAYGLISPGMPQLAAELGLHYARIAVSGEPLQAAQFWPALVSQAFFQTGSPEDALREALHAVDPTSALAAAVRDAIQAFHDHPDDWKTARQSIHVKWYDRYRWNDNSTPLNGAVICLALLYGNGDFYRTLQYAMALGYDADCNAATAGATVGARTGFKKISGMPQFRMPDVYVNHTRPQLPQECPVSMQVRVLTALAEKAILSQGGQQISIGGNRGYRIARQEIQNLEPLPPDAPKPRPKGGD